MKKLFEKPLIHYTFVLTIVSIVCGLAIGGVNFITAPIIDDNIAEAKLEAFNLVLPGLGDFEEVSVDGDPATIVSKVIGKNAEGQTIGYIYEAYATNKFGYMRIVISVDASGVIIGADFVEINQTLNVAGTKNNLALYVGTSIYDLEPNGDLSSGATYSLNTVKAILNDVAVAHANTVVAPALPYEDWFGMNYTMEEDGTFVPTNVVFSKHIVKDENNVVVGYFYHMSEEGVYNGYEHSIGTIHLYVGLGLDGTILGIDLPKDEFGHTKTSQFWGKNVTYVNSLVGSNIDSFGGNEDLAAGSSNTRVLIDAMLLSLGGVFE
ncbi:MAG: hypothetical protein CVV58_03950 [Tenericutes bacterium HGW-Tenericutes-3]|nr:MAG: hypothetical protein CVV58_03950 [Tenericutes bacterium HGW-Tenericutes-3]